MSKSGSAECPFCRDLNALANLPADSLVWEFPHSVAFLGAWQYYQGYCLLVSRQHVNELFFLSEIVRKAYLDEMCILAQAIYECFKPHKLNYELLGNQVPHLHWHLFPRYKEDPNLLQPVWVELRDVQNDEPKRGRLVGSNVDRSATARQIREVLTRWLGNGDQGTVVTGQ